MSEDKVIKLGAKREKMRNTYIMNIEKTMTNLFIAVFAVAQTRKY